MRKGKTHVADIRFKPAGIGISCVVVASKIHLSEPVCERLPPCACDILIHPCFLLHGDNVTEFVGDSKVIKHGTGTYYLNAVAVFSAHECPTIWILVKTCFGKVDIGLVLFVALAVDIDVHIFHAQIFTVALPQLFIVLKVSLQKSVIDLTCGVIVSVENDKVLRFSIVSGFAVAPLVADKEFVICCLNSCRQCIQHRNRHNSACQQCG